MFGRKNPYRKIEDALRLSLQKADLDNPTRLQVYDALLLANILRRGSERKVA
jgi:hypothetical protein